MSNQVYLIRHAQSVYNLASDEWLKQHGSMYNSDCYWNPELRDPQITDLGYQQANEAIPIVHAIDFKKVYVSPMRRALQTCKILFSDHPSRPQIIVQPMIHEKMACSSDVSLYSGEPFPEFSEFDWSNVTDEYYIRQILTQEKAQMLAGLTPAQCADNFLEIMRNIYPQKIETKDEFSIRSQTFRDRVLDEAKEIGNIAVVGHFMLFKYMTRGYVESEFRMRNCEVKALNGQRNAQYQNLIQQNTNLK